MSRFRVAAVALSFLLLIFVARSLEPEDDTRMREVKGFAVNQPAVNEATERSGERLSGPQQPTTPEQLLCSEDHDAVALDLPAMAAALAKSNDPEHLLMASLYGGEARKPHPSHFPQTPNLTSLFRALQIDPTNELLLWNAVSLCAKESEQSRCEAEQVPELATAILQGNANFWLRLAGLRADAGDDDGALEAMERAVAAPNFKDYHIDHVELFARGIASYDNSPYYLRISNALGLAAALWSPEVLVIATCKAHSPTSTRWMSACIDAGEKMEALGTSLMTEALGIGLQRQMHEIAGNTELEEATAIRRQTLTDTLRNQVDTIELAVLFNDETVLAGYIDEWKARGERHALEFLKGETKRVLSIPGYELCD